MDYIILSGRKRQAIKCNCNGCGKEYLKDKRYDQDKRLKEGHKNYCSRACYISSNIKKEEVICCNCSKSILKDYSDIVKNKSGKYFCSVSCKTSYFNKLRIEENNPNYKNGKSYYRQKALNFYGCKCSVCGYSIVEALEVHHKDCNRRNNKIENLDVLCPTHHKEYQLGILNY